MHLINATQYKNLQHKCPPVVFASETGTKLQENNLKSAEHDGASI